MKKSWLEAHKACLGGGGTAKGHAELRVPEPVALAGTVTSCFPNGELLVWASVLGNEAFAKLSLLPKQFLLHSLVALIGTLETAGPKPTPHPEHSQVFPVLNQMCDG